MGCSGDRLRKQKDSRFVSHRPSLTDTTIRPGSSCPGPEWAEQERAEQLARGAALKWASGIFYRPEQLARLAQYRSREVQRNYSLEARLKVRVGQRSSSVGVGSRAGQPLLVTSLRSLLCSRTWKVYRLVCGNWPEPSRLCGERVKP